MVSRNKDRAVFNEDNPAWLNELSGREREILGLSAAGLIDKAIAIELGITLTTLRTYWVRIRRKTGDLTRAALAVAFVKSQFKQDDPGQASQRSMLLMSVSNDPETLRRAAIYYATAFQRAEDSLLRVTNACKILATLPRQSFRVKTETGLLNLICRAFVEVGDYEIAWVGLPLHDATKSVQIAALATRQNHPVIDFKVSWADDEQGNGPSGRALRTGKSQVSHDYLVDPSVAPWRELAESYGFQSSAAFPLVSQGKTIGVISVYAREPNSFDEPEVRVLELIAHDCAISLSEIRSPTQT